MTKNDAKTDRQFLSVKQKTLTLFLGLVLHAIPTSAVASAMIKDAVDRITSDEKGHKIYANSDIYAFNGLGPKGKPLKE